MKDVTHDTKISSLDVIEDFEEIAFIAQDAKNKLSQFLRDIQTHVADISPSVHNQISSETTRFLSFYIQILSQCSSQISHIKQTPLVTVLQQARETRESLRALLRSHQGILGTLLTSTDWQSPSYDHTTYSQAGKQTGTIVATINDYKRDQHRDAFVYERAFLREYIDTTGKLNMLVCATSSGMSACATIIQFLLGTLPKNSHVLSGNSVYFQNKFLLETAFGPNIHTVSEHDPEGIIRIYQNIKPRVLFFDSLTNAEAIPVVDFSKIIPSIYANATEDTYIVIDNTGLSISNQFLRTFGKTPKHIHIILFESLNKYYQFGMDRVTGGIFWCKGKITDQLFTYRIHAGTNIPDAIVASLPTPNRTLLTKRLSRLNRNALFVSRTLDQYIRLHPQSPIHAIHYPGLPSHASYEWMKHATFFGSYFTIELKEFYQSVPVYKRFITHVFKTAKDKHVPLVAGSSFGLNTTRIYLTAMRSTPAKPFIRISVGTEDWNSIKELSNALETALKTFT